MKVVNPRGRVVSITPKMWDELKDKGFELVKEVEQEEKPDIAQLKYSELQQLAKELGVNSYGLKKPDLIDALIDARDKVGD